MPFRLRRGPSHCSWPGSDGRRATRSCLSDEAGAGTRNRCSYHAAIALVLWSGREQDDQCDGCGSEARREPRAHSRTTGAAAHSRCTVHRPAMARTRGFHRDTWDARTGTAKDTPRAEIRSNTRKGVRRARPLKREPNKFSRFGVLTLRPQSAPPNGDADDLEATLSASEARELSCTGRLKVAAPRREEKTRGVAA